MKKANISPRFYLDNKKKNPTLIFLSFKYLKNEPPLRYSTGWAIDPAKWDFKKQQPKDLSVFRGLADELKRFEVAALNVFEKLGEVNKVRFKMELDYELGFRKRETDTKVPGEIMPFIWWHIAVKKNDVAKNYSDGYLRGLKTSARKLQSFLEIQPYTFDDIGKVFWEELKLHLMDGQTVNYLNKKITQISQFFEAADMEGVFDYTKRKRPSLFHPDDVYFEILTESELNRIEAIELPPFQTKCRDLFLIGCYTGLRVSDYTKLRKEDFIREDGQLMLRVKSKKGRKYIFVPVDEKVESVFEKYGWDVPRTNEGKKIYDVHINQRIKIVAEKAEITKDVEVVRTRAYKGGLKEEREVLPKFKTLSSHYGRRYYLTYWYKRGISMAKLMKISGHKKESTFLRYINIDGKENAKEVAIEMRKKRTNKLRVA